jgi:hypothetical protein
MQLWVWRDWGNWRLISQSVSPSRFVYRSKQLLTLWIKFTTRWQYESLSLCFVTLLVLLITPVVSVGIFVVFITRSVPELCEQDVACALVLNFVHNFILWDLFNFVSLGITTTKFQYNINNMHCIVCALCPSDVMIVPLVCSTVWFYLLANLISSSDISKR